MNKFFYKRGNKMKSDKPKRTFKVKRAEQRQLETLKEIASEESKKKPIENSLIC